MQKDKKNVIRVRILLVVWVIILIYPIFFNPTSIDVFMFFLALISAILTQDIYSQILEGLPKEIYYNNIEDKNIADGLEIAKFNIQTLHNFLVMGIAVIALAISLYSLLIKADLFVSQIGIPVAKALIASVLGMMAAVILINYEWFRKFNKLITIKRRNQN